MHTKDSLSNGGVVDGQRTFVSWKDPLREISCSRTNVEDTMLAAYAIAELAGGSVSADRERNYDENVRDCKVRWGLPADERMEFIGRWMDSQSHGKTVVTRYLQGQNPDMPLLRNALEANRGRKRKMESSVESGSAQKYVTLENGMDNRRHGKTVKMAGKDFHTTPTQNPESQYNDQSAEYFPAAINSSHLMRSSCVEEARGRFIRSTVIASNIPRQIDTHSTEDKSGGRFVRTSMRGPFPSTENGRAMNPMPGQWSANLSNSTVNCGSLVDPGCYPIEMLKVRRRRSTTVPFKKDSLDRVVNVCEGSLQSSEIVRNNPEATPINSPPVSSEVSRSTRRHSLSTDSTETSVSDEVLRNSVSHQHPLFIKQQLLDEGIFHNSAIESYRQRKPPSANGTGHAFYMTNLENGLLHSNINASGHNAFQTSVHEYGAGPPALEPLERPESKERMSEGRLRRNPEAPCERDLFEPFPRKRNEELGIAQHIPFQNSRPIGDADYALKLRSSHSGSNYSNYDVQIQEYYTATALCDRVAIQREMPPLLQRLTTESCEPKIAYRKEVACNETFQWTTTPIRDQLNEDFQLAGFGCGPPVYARQTNHRWVECRREKEKKPLNRSKSLSPAIKSNVQSGQFGSLQSIRTYYKTLGEKRPETGTAKEAESCPDSHRFTESSPGRTDLPIDLSSRVRERGQNVLESAANANRATFRFIDPSRRRNSEISGGHLPQREHAKFPAPGTIPYTPRGALSNASGVDIQENLLEVSSPSLSQPSSRLSSPSSMPDSHLPPKKRRMQNIFPPAIDSSSSEKEVPNISASPDVDRSPDWNHIPASVEESHELETRAQQRFTTGELPERFVHPCLWQDNGLENLEDVQWAATPDEDGDLPLHVGVARGSESYVRKCVRIMSRLGTSIDLYDSNRKTALQIAVISSQPNIVEMLLRANASPNVVDRSGANSIHLAVRHGELDCLKTLLTHSKHILDLDARNYEGLAALHMAVISNQLEAVRILLRVGASVDVADGKTGQTPLHYVAERNSQQMAKLLLVYGANPFRASYSGCTPVQLASAKSHLELAKVLEQSTIILSNGTVTARKVLLVKEQ